VGDLQAVVAGSLTLTCRAVHGLATTPGLDAEKVVGEALLLLRTTRSAAGQQAWQDLYAATAPLARPATLAASLCRDPSRAPELAFAHVMLADLGAPDPGLDLLLDLALADEPTGPEAAVVPALQRQWLLGVRRGGPAGTARDELLRRSGLARPVVVLRCSTQDVYDLTHAVMHGADLGGWRLTAPRTESELTADLDALVGLALDADNLDLTTELLWAWPMLRLGWTPTARLALDIVLRTFRARGYLPGPGHDPTSPGAETELLATSYHATLVLGILAGALLDAGDLGECPGPVPTVRGSGAEVLDVLTADAPRPWTRAADRLSDHELDGLAPMLLAVALRRASDRAELADVRRLLELAVRLGLTDGRAVVQATGLLRRGTALARYVASPRPARHQAQHHGPFVVEHA
jgi:hypothetical protein